MGRLHDTLTQGDTSFHNYFQQILSILNIRRLIISILTAFAGSLSLFALDPTFYAENSVLSSGKWVRVSVAETGMQFISNSTLKNFGFTNPDKVNVYGCGGRVLPELLNSSMYDDLPLVASIHTSAGIVFFGHSSVRWESDKSGKFPYTHTSNPYSDNSYYFLSDRETDLPATLPTANSPLAGGTPQTSFLQRLLHEQDLLAPANSGRHLFGEDFRTQNTRTFNFSLPGNTGNAEIRTYFAAKVTNGASSLVFSANGTQLEATSSDRISGVASSETFFTSSSSIKTVSSPGEKLSLSIRYSNTGNLYLAALDYIEVVYPRNIDVSSGEIYFYLEPASPTLVNVAGAGANTVIWDVTDPLSIKKVDYTLSGSTAQFSVPAGYREYVAFDPSKVKRTAAGAGKVTCQNLHGTPAPGMLIITPEKYRAQAQRIAALHDAYDNLSVLVVTPEEIYNEFSSGVPDVTAFRKLLKMWYDRAGGDPKAYTRYCLIFSRPTYDNKMVTPSVRSAGYPRVPIWQSAEGFTESGSYSTDDYIGMLADNNGSMNMASAQIHVAVGRFPVKNVTEAENAVAKLEKYILTPNRGAWRSNVMVIADDQDRGEHLDQAEKVIKAMRTGKYGRNLVYEKLYLDSYPLGQSGSGPVYPEAKQRMFDKIAEGVSLIDYIGHASPSGWGHENLLTWTDLTSMTNTNLPFIYAGTCEFLEWDADAVSGAEEMWLNPEAGVIGMICPSRKVYISVNGILNENTGYLFFSQTDEGLPRRLGEIMIEGKNKSTGETNKLRYGFMGDPSMRLPYPEFDIEITDINGLDPEGEETPVLKARSDVSLSGRIVDMAGNTVTGYNGTIRIQLYDAERVIETFGNGKEGEVRTYNDRKTRLHIGEATVRDGVWTSKFIMPSEIENNWSPAMISLYACDEQGREANGGTESLYVYGFEENAAEDYEGPVISDFWLNSPDFADGASVGPSAMLHASVSDPSGINLSEAGIGHGMTVSLDGKKWYNDVQLYFSPDPESFERGVISYPVSSIEPGVHTLELTVWDTANNSSTASLTFTVNAAWAPTISDLSTDVSPAVTSVVFNVAVDGASGQTPCKLEVFDLMGRLVWTSPETSFSENATKITHRWNLRDSLGRRVNRGIYIYRATVVTPEGREIRRSEKLAVADGE